MRHVQTRPPSFPEVAFDQALPWEDGKQWQVVCGDRDHWRVGMYSPAETSRAQLPELERHDCPELFVLLRGSLTLLIADGPAVRELPLQPGVPVLVTSPHAGFCPMGPHSGVALVVERDAFDTEYREQQAWVRP
jgi:hypothetical protein